MDQLSNDKQGAAIANYCAKYYNSFKQVGETVSSQNKSDNNFSQLAKQQVSEAAKKQLKAVSFHSE